MQKYETKMLQFVGNMCGACLNKQNSADKINKTLNTTLFWLNTNKIVLNVTKLKSFFSKRKEKLIHQN